MPIEEPWFTRHLPKVDFSKPLDARAFIGYLKESPDYKTSRIWRLYLSLDLDEYLEIHEDHDMLGTLPLESAQNPLGGTAVWVRRSSQVRLVRTEGSTEHGSVDFVRGKIVAQYLRGAQMGGPHRAALMMPAGIKTPQDTVACPLTYSGCMTAFTQCDPCGQKAAV